MKDIQKFSYALCLFFLSGVQDVSYCQKASTSTSNKISVKVPWELKVDDSVNVVITNENDFAQAFHITEFDSVTTNFESIFTGYRQSTALNIVSHFIKSPVRHQNRHLIANIFSNYPPKVALFYQCANTSLSSMQCGNFTGLGASMLIRSGLFDWKDFTIYSYNGIHTVSEINVGGSPALVDFDPNMPSFTVAGPNKELSSIQSIHDGTNTIEERWLSQEGYDGTLGASLLNYQKIFTDHQPDFIGHLDSNKLLPLADANDFILCSGCSISWEYSQPMVFNAADQNTLGQINLIANIYRKYSKAPSPQLHQQLIEAFALINITTSNPVRTLMETGHFFGQPTEVFPSSIPTLTITVPEQHTETILIGPHGQLNIPFFVLGGNITGGSATIGDAIESGNFEYPLYNTHPTGANNRKQPSPIAKEIQVLTSGKIPPGVGATIRVSYNPGYMSFLRGFELYGNDQPLKVDYKR